MASISPDAWMLLDHNVPLPMRRAMEVRTRFRVEPTAHRGWERLTNGDLLAEAEGAGFDLLVTADQSLRYQQNLKGRRIAIDSLATYRWSEIRANLDQLIAALDVMEIGSFVELTFGRRSGG